MASFIFNIGITAREFFIFFKIDLRVFEKFGLAESCIKTLEIPLCFIKYFKALNVDSCLVFPP